MSNLWSFWELLLLRILKSSVHFKTLPETEKYAHVTFFFNGGREEAFAGEDREMVPSPKVATYDLQPTMNAAGVADAVGNSSVIFISYYVNKLSLYL